MSPRALSGFRPGGTVGRLTGHDEAQVLAIPLRSHLVLLLSSYLNTVAGYSTVGSPAYRRNRGFQRIGRRVQQGAEKLRNLPNIMSESRG